MEKRRPTLAVTLAPYAPLRAEEACNLLNKFSTAPSRRTSIANASSMAAAVSILKHTISDLLADKLHPEIFGQPE